MVLESVQLVSWQMPKLFQNYFSKLLFFLNFWRTQVFFVGLLIPLFWTSGDVCSGFQSQGGSLACFLTCVILRFTSGDCRSQYGSQVFLIHIPADVSTGIGGGSGLESITVRATRSKYGHSGSAIFFKNLNMPSQKVLFAPRRMFNRF